MITVPIWAAIVFAPGIAAAVLAWGYWLGDSNASRTVRRLERRNDELITRGDERLWFYKQACAIARAFAMPEAPS